MKLQSSDFSQGRAFNFSNQLDQAFLKQNFGENLDLAKNIFHQFVISIEKELENLDKAISEKSFESIGFISHKIKNNFTYVGANHVAKLIGELESEAKNNSRQINNLYSCLLYTSPSPRD